MKVWLERGELRALKAQIELHRQAYGVNSEARQVKDGQEVILR